MVLDELRSYYLNIKEKALFGRYIHNDHITPLASKFDKFTIKEIGRSVNNEKIVSYSIGTGNVRLLFWSQMHGNESTSTKALFDLFNFFELELDLVDSFLKHFTLVFVPILNPDGARLYTRLNMNMVDLNRDAQKKTQPESVVLDKIFSQFKPHYCFNLHGQRTIFSAGSSNNSAVLSFLSPSQDANKTITDSRKSGMCVINDIVKELGGLIPNCIGRYDDGFNINCVGDTFQSQNVPTILYEAGHVPGDYAREVTREYFFYALFYGILSIYENNTCEKDHLGYLEIPENEKLFCDVLLRNVNHPSLGKTDLYIQYKEELIENKIHFTPVLKGIGNAIAKFGHVEIDCESMMFYEGLSSNLEIEEIVRYLVFDNKNIIKYLKNQYFLNNFQ